MNRRVFLAGGLALAGLVRRASAQLANRSVPVRYAPLTTSVKIPLAAVATPWQPVAFVAEARAKARRVLISGLLFRNDTSLSALCVTCPQ